jgi:outer membrane protein insertion porin family
MPRFFFVPVATLFLVAASLPLSAQKFLPKTIQFKGAPEYSDQELMAAAGLKKGVVLNYAEMSSHSKQLMDSGVFDNLAFKFDGQDLVYQLIPSTQLYPMRLENLPLTPGKDLDAKLNALFPLYHGKVPSEGTLLDGVRGALEQMLAAQGIQATVSSAPFFGLGQTKVSAMSFAITSPEVVVGDIYPDSSSAALDSEAQHVLGRQSGSPYDAEGSPSQIATNLGNFYRDKGYLDAQIHATAQLPGSATAFSLRIPFAVSISTGPLFRVTGIQLAPGLAVTQADFDRQSGIHPGDIADAARIRQNWQFIVRQYHNKGYLKADVRPTPILDRAHGTATFTVTVEPGPIYSMGALRIDGVSDELRAAMMAAWKIPAGAVFNESAVTSLYAIGDANLALARVFAKTNCKYSLQLNDENHTVDVVLRLEKRP